MSIKLKFILIVLLGILGLTCEKFSLIIAVKTGTSSNIAKTSASVSGTIVDIGNGINSHGHCWSKTIQNPTPGNCDGKTELGSINSLSDFTSTMDNLEPGTLYYIAAYASNTEESVTGKVVTLTTLVNPSPNVTTTAASAIAQTTAILNGVVDAFSESTAVTFEYGTSLSYGNEINAMPSPVSGSGNTLVSASVSGLTKNTLYHYRVKGVSINGTSSGNDLTFTTASAPTVPSLTTTAISDKTSITATSGGNIVSDGDAAVTSRGVCWSTSSNPTTALTTKTIDGSGTGEFVSSLTGLTASTTYFVRAYAINSEGTAYGNEVSFTTLATPAVIPTLTTTAISALGQTSVTSGGDITNDGGAAVTARGVCWSSTSNPTIALTTKTSDGINTGNFVSSITGLTANTTYFVRAYAINSVGTAYGNEISFKTLQNSSVPTLTTTAASSISQTTAKSGGDISSDGGAAVTSRGVCWSISTNPTIALTTKTNDGSGIGNFISSISGLTASTTYFIRAYATNSVGTEYGAEKSFTTLANINVAIGDSYQGGKVAYIFQNGDPGFIFGEKHGIIAAIADQSTSAPWGCLNTLISGADGAGLGAGKQNTIDILAGCSTAGIAAKLCTDLVLNGYDDWYLPSTYELEKLYINNALIGSFNNAYWSSTEDGASSAFYIEFQNGGYINSNDKSVLRNVRAIRNF